MARLEGGARASAEGRGVEAGAPVVRLAGELDISNVATIEAAIEPFVVGATERVVFDVGDLDFMDSSGIGLLLRVAERVGAVELRDPSPVIRRIVETMGLSEVLRITP